VVGAFADTTVAVASVLLAAASIIGFAVGVLT
jgi:hypothetical protein